MKLKLTKYVRKHKMPTILCSNQYMVVSNLEEEAQYRQVKTAYSVRFFPEMRAGERRPDELKDKGITEGWETTMPLELAFYLEMTRRSANRIANGKRDTEGQDVFSSARTVNEVRAIATCLLIEKQSGFPFKSIKKAWTADEMLGLSSGIGMASRRHEAIIAQSVRLNARGVHVVGEQCGMNFARLSPEHLRKLPIPGLMDQMSIPLGILARLDGYELETVENVTEWLASFLRMPKVTHEFLEGLKEQMIPMGVSLLQSRFRIDRDMLNMDAIRGIKLSDVIPGVELTFGDVARMNGCLLENEDSLRGLLNSHSYGQSTRINHQHGHGIARIRASISRAVGQTTGEDEDGLITQVKKPKPKHKHEEQERGSNAAFNHYRRELSSKRIDPVREAEIVDEMRKGIPFGTFQDEIANGYQIIMLNWILGIGSSVHNGREEDIKEILSEANLNFVRRSGGFSLKDEIKHPIRQFVFSCVYSAIADVARSGLVTGIKMTSKADRAVLSHSKIVEEALMLYADAKNQDPITIILPPTEKYPGGRSRTFKKGELETGLLKLYAMKGRNQPVRTGKDGEETYIVERDAIDSETPGVNAELRSKKRAMLLAEFQDLLLRGFGDKRHIALLINEMRLRFGLANSTTKDELARSIGVTPSRVSQLVCNDDEPTGKRLNQLFGPRLRQHFTDEEIMILIGRDQEETMEDYL